MPNGEADKVVIRAFNEEHTLLENEKNAIAEYFVTLKAEESKLEQYTTWLEGIQKIIANIESHDAALKEKLVEVIENPHAMTNIQSHNKEAMKQSLAELESSISILTRVKGQLQYQRNAETQQATNTVHANWKVIMLLEKVIAKSERTIGAIKNHFKDMLK